MKKFGRNVQCKIINIYTFNRKADVNKKAGEYTFDEFEKQNYEQFIFISQLLRGTIKGLSQYKDQIN